ncbi:MAG: hypothetical protein ACRDE2_06300, partial [Chitinophagaceae bacterium]
SKVSSSFLLRLKFSFHHVILYELFRQRPKILILMVIYHRIVGKIQYNHSKNGKKRKLKCLERFAQNEKDYVSNRPHVHGRRLIDLCLKHEAATIPLVGLQVKETKAKDDGFLFRNWSYRDLKNKICHKAEKVGIKVIAQ